MSIGKQIMLDTPAVYLPLDDLSGSPVDRSGNGLHGSVQGSGHGYGVAGPSGVRAMSFNGSGNLTMTDHAALDYTADFAYEVWFKTTSAAMQWMIQKYNHPTESNGIMGYLLSGQAYFDLRAGGSSYQSFGPTPLAYHDGIWHQLVWRRTGSNYQICMDGVQVINTAGTGGSVANNQTLYFATGSAGSDRFVGSLAHFASFPGLSDERLRVHYEAGRRMAAVT